MLTSTNVGVELNWKDCKNMSFLTFKRLWGCSLQPPPHQSLSDAGSASTINAHTTDDSPQNASLSDCKFPICSSKFRYYESELRLETLSLHLSTQGSVGSSENALVGRVHLPYLCAGQMPHNSHAYSSVCLLSLLYHTMMRSQLNLRICAPSFIAFEMISHSRAI